MKNNNEEIFVVALGGNAIITLEEEGTLEQQTKHIHDTILNLKDLFKKGSKVVITHGNGLQVGNLFEQQLQSSHPEMPLFILDAMTEAQIGYFLQEALKDYLNLNSSIVLTRITVDKNDQAFKKPTKPIGPFIENGGKKVMITSPDLVEQALTGKAGTIIK